jgi:hypothetical protein
MVRKKSGKQFHSQPTQKKKKRKEKEKPRNKHKDMNHE